MTNTGDTDETVLIEHPDRTDRPVKRVEPKTPLEETASVLQFETKLPAGQSAESQVVEARELGEEVVLTDSRDDTVRFVITLNESSHKNGRRKTALGKKVTWDDARRELQQVVVDLARLTADRDRTRKNLRETPEKAGVYAEYL